MLEQTVGQYPVWLIILIILLILLLLYLWWARQRGRFPFPPLTYPPEEYYVQDQLILTGPVGLVDNAVGHLENVRLERLDRMEFSQFGDRLLDCPGLPNGAGKDALVIDLYKIHGWFSSVSRAIQQIDRILGSQANLVHKDPNWLTGHPFEPEGSPFEPEGSPFEPEGSAGGAPAPEAPPEWFLRQWAFQVIELAPAEGLYPGGGVRVGIFDSSPYGDVHPGAQALKIIHQPEVPPPWELKVIHPKAWAQLPPSSRAHFDVRNHGYYIAGLVHAVARQSEINLIRVLGNDNRGDLYTLLRSIFDFLKGAAVDQPPETGAVLSLSLGIRVPPEEAKFGLPISVLALQYLLNAAGCLDVVAVAAAGNNSAKTRLPEPSNLPAAWVSTIGVAASNKYNRRACFSNLGDLAAPGGDGRAHLPAGEKAGDISHGGPAPDDGCQPRNKDCQDGECETAVIGPAIRQPYRDETNTCYVYWSGSSFSTPLVSGLAARVLQAGEGHFSPAQVEAIIACGATPTPDTYLGAGVINVRCTLTECLQAGVKQPCRPAAG